MSSSSSTSSLSLVDDPDFVVYGTHLGYEPGFGYRLVCIDVDFGHRGDRFGEFAPPIRRPDGQRLHQPIPDNGIDTGQRSRHGDRRFRRSWYGQRPGDGGCGARGLARHALGAAELGLGRSGIQPGWLGVAGRQRQRDSRGVPAGPGGMLNGMPMRTQRDARYGRTYRLYAQVRFPSHRGANPGIRRIREGDHPSVQSRRLCDRMPVRLSPSITSNDLKLTGKRSQVCARLRPGPRRQ